MPEAYLIQSLANSATFRFWTQKNYHLFHIFFFACKRLWKKCWYTQNIYHITISESCKWLPLRTHLTRDKYHMMTPSANKSNMQHPTSMLNVRISTFEFKTFLCLMHIFNIIIRLRYHCINPAISGRNYKKENNWENKPTIKLIHSLIFRKSALVYVYIFQGYLISFWRAPAWQSDPRIIKVMDNVLRKVHTKLCSGITNWY